MRVQPRESVQLVTGADGDSLLLTDSYSDKNSERREAAEKGL